MSNKQNSLLDILYESSNKIELYNPLSFLDNSVNRFVSVSLYSKNNDLNFDINYVKYISFSKDKKFIFFDYIDTDLGIIDTLYFKLSDYYSIVISFSTRLG